MNQHQFGRGGGGGEGSNPAAVPPPSLSQRLSVRHHDATLPNTASTAPAAPDPFATGSATGSVPPHPSATHHPSARANTSFSYHYSKPPKLSPVALAARLAASAAAAAARPLRPASSLAAPGTAQAATPSTAHARHMAKIAQAAHGNHAAQRDRERDAHSRAALAQAHSGPARPVKPKADLYAAARSAVPAAAVGAAAAAAAAAESNECRLMQRAHQVVVGLSWGTLPPAQQERWTQIQCDRRLQPSQGGPGPSSSMQGGAG